MTAIDWGRSAFVLVTPDAVRRHLHGEVIERVRALGLEPVAFRCLHADADLLDALYQVHITEHWDTYRYRILDQAFRLERCLAVVFEAADDDPAPATARVSAVKGYQHPAQAEPGTLRRDLGAINSVLGLLHSSDDEGEAEREAAVFGIEERSGSPAQVAGKLSTATRLLALGRPAERRVFDDVLAGVRARALFALWQRLDAETQDLVASRVAEPWRLADAETTHALRARLDGRVDQQVGEALACEFTPESRIDMRTARNVLAGLGAALDDWEAVVLASSMHFAPRRMGVAERTPVA